MRIFGRKKKPTQKARSFKSTKKGRPKFEQERDVNSILHAQRTVGNQGVMRSLHEYEAAREASQSTRTQPGYAHEVNQKPSQVNAPDIQRDTSEFRKRVIAKKEYKLYLREITYSKPDPRFTNTVRKKWLQLLYAYHAGLLKDTKYITINDMKYNKVSDFDSDIKTMLEITWAKGDNPKILAEKLNKLDDELNAAKRLMKKMTKPSGFLGKSWVRKFHAARDDDKGKSFMNSGSWTHAFSWRKWLTFWK